MKKLITIFLILQQIVCWGQQIEFQYNAVTNSIESIHKGDLVRMGKYYVKLDKVNTAYYKVIIDIKQSNLKSSVPDILKPYLPGLTSNDFIFPNGGSLNIISAGMVVAGDPYHTKIETLYNEAVTEYKKLNNLIIESNSLKVKIIANKSDPSICASEAKASLTSILSSFALRPVTDKVLLKEQINKSIGIFNSNWEAVKLILDNHPVTVPEVLLDNLKDFSRFNQFIVENKLKFSEIADFVYSTTKAVSSVETNQFVNNRDLTAISFILTRRLEGDTLLKHKLELFTKGGLKLDFTTGFFFNTISSNDYYIEAKSDGNKLIRKEENPRSDLAIGALAHFSYRISSDFKIGPGIGAAVSPLDGKIRYLGGISIVIGRKNQLAISGGAALAKVKALSGKISSNGVDPFDVIPADITSVPTYDKHKWGAFFGISYNLTSK